MSDYMFMLESHLSTDQFRVVADMQKIAANMGVSLYLTGGAMRDMLGGHPVRGLGFTIEGSAAKLATALSSGYASATARTRCSALPSGSSSRARVAGPACDACTARPRAATTASSVLFS